MWHLLTGVQIIDLFDEHFDNATIQPNKQIVTRLKMLEVATLEILENRTASSIYRIKQTGEVYQIIDTDGTTFEFNDYEDYQQASPVDELIEAFVAKEPVHVIKEEDGQLFIYRLKPPRFKARYVANDPLSNLQDIEFSDEVTNVSEMASLMRKAGAFIANYLKKE